jgi:hypothetical protein
MEMRLLICSSPPRYNNSKYNYDIRYPSNREWNVRVRKNEHNNAILKSNLASKNLIMCTYWSRSLVVLSLSPAVLLFYAWLALPLDSPSPEGKEEKKGKGRKGEGRRK